MWRLLRHRLELRLTVIVALVVVLGSCLLYGFGCFTSYVVHPDASMIRPLDRDHWIYSLIVQLVYTPFVWTLYLWQPTAIHHTLRSLRRNDVILETREHSFEWFRDRMHKALAGWPLVGVVSFVVLLVLLLETVAIFPAQTARAGIPFYWFYDKAYYFLVWVPVVYLTVYVTVMLVAQGIVALIWFNNLFRWFQAKLHPLHPDGRGGFAPLGSLGIRYGLIAVALGIGVVSFDANRLVVGMGGLYVDSLLFWGFYAVLTPACLVLPLWSAHQAMVRTRDELLSGISQDFDRALERSGAGSVLGEGSEVAWRRAEELKARHQSIRASYPTWPISFAAAGKFSLSALAPVVLGLVSIVLDMMSRRAAGG